jgi:hypothetical protein
MTMTKQQEKRADAKQHEGELLQALVGERIMVALGEPEDLRRVQVRQLWGDYFRVNVFVGADAGCTRIAHSFFVAADSDGNIVRSTPELTRRY